MERFLDPRTYLTFRRVFVEHKELMISLLNVFLPLPEGVCVTEVENLEPELLPENIFRENHFADVQCIDNRGGRFIVEIQMYWTEVYFDYDLENHCEKYGLERGQSDGNRGTYAVYNLVFLDDNLDEEEYDVGDGYLHTWQLGGVDNQENATDGMSLSVIELRKFAPAENGEKTLAELWLLFFTKISRIRMKTDVTLNELIQNNEIKEAIEILDNWGYSDGEIAWYERFWDSVRMEKSLVHDAKNRRKAAERAKTEEKIAKKMKEQGYSLEIISQVTNVPIERLKGL